ncbi:anti-sigma factor antagonist [Streptomyces lunaelactis]|uniref:anti-sigma factor antagonist n=1 Tax=Streptomyces lunaelactis TaxID=1535768 RepID=UPI0015847501|nr:anti-sigma factor antagonist [Streptomyces lunaelactis]NUL04667.1 anti-sigma factor antagonist [Streptomyces lunaelactis]
MSISWSFEEPHGVAVMRVAGYLGSNAVDRFSEGFGWVAARSTGTVLLDVSELLGWSAEGEAAVLQAAAALKERERSLAVCGPGHLEATRLWTDQVHSMTVYADLDTALSAEAPSSG